jgi:hypothetical protein
MHLKDCGHTNLTRDKIRAVVKASMSEVLTGTIEVPHKNKKGRTMRAPWLQVVDPLAALTKVVHFELAAGLVSWPSNIPDGEFWIGLGADKGGGATKLLAKFMNVELADSWRHTCLLAVLDRIDDS